MNFQGRDEEATCPPHFLDPSDAPGALFGWNALIIMHTDVKLIKIVSSVNWVCPRRGFTEPPPKKCPFSEIDFLDVSGDFKQKKKKNSSKKIFFWT